MTSLLLRTRVLDEPPSGRVAAMLAMSSAGEDPQYVLNKAPRGPWILAVQPWAPSPSSPSQQMQIAAKSTANCLRWPHNHHLTYIVYT